MFFGAVCAALFCAACGDGSEPAARPAPAATAAITDVRPGKFEVAFTVTCTDAVSYAYACLRAGETPSPDDCIAAEGSGGACTAEDLTPGTDYTLVAYAVNADGVRSDPAFCDFTTARLPSLAIGTCTPAETSAQFEVTTADAELLFWACTAAGEADPMDFTRIEAAECMLIEAEGLQPGTEYVFRAYVADAEARSEAVSLPFATMAPSSVDLSAGGTANCYVVGEAGVYSFAADMRGNGVSANHDAESKRFEGAIAIGDGYTADWLWASDEGIVSDVVFDRTAKRIRFTASGRRGNAVIALFDGARVVWSWHVWATDDPAAQPVSGTAGALFLDRNLGATSTAVDDPASFGFFYQWGRKDPFIAASAIVNPTGYAVPEGDPFRTELEGHYTVNPSYGATWTTLDNDDAAIASGASVEYAAEHPMTFVSYRAQVGSSGVGAWFNDDNVRYAELWGFDFVEKDNIKTMFDPCPPGYKVPGWYKESMADAGTATMTRVGEQQSRTYNGGYWPAQGYRTREGKLSNIGKYGYYWSACAFNYSNNAQNYKGYMLYWYSRMVSASTVQDEAIGGNVRCVRE